MNLNGTDMLAHGGSLVVELGRRSEQPGPGDPARPYALPAGGLAVTGSLSGPAHTYVVRALFKDLPAPRVARNDVTIQSPDGRKNTCPVCRREAQSVVIAGVLLRDRGNHAIGPSPAVEILVRAGGRVFDLVGYDPRSYRCQPCGCEFDHDENTIDNGSAHA